MLVVYILLVIILVSKSSALKCRTREHMKQQQDFYNLAGNCMKISMNVTSTSKGSEDYGHRQQQNRGNRPNNYDDYYETNHHIDSRVNRNKIGFTNNDDEISKDGNMCNPRMENNNHRKNNGKEEMRYPLRYREKRDASTVQKFVRKNSTTTGTKKSPLEDIGACVIHCIFREMKMLNSDSKADRQAMSSVMTDRIHNSELREFIQDSIEECFDIMDSGSDIFSKDSTEEQCEFSKKLILCLEEKAKRGCEDWEISENSTDGNSNNFNFNKPLGSKNNGNDQISHQKY